MHGDRIKETSTSTGTGNLTTAGAVAGFRTLNSEFSNDTTGAGIPFGYYVTHDTDNSWEAGYGHLSASTTLVRDVVTRSSNADAAVNFASGGLTITATPIAQSLQPNLPYTPAGTANDRIIAPPWWRLDGASGTPAAGTIFYQPYFWPGGKADAIACDVSTSQASITTKMAIFTWLPTTGYPGRIVIPDASLTHTDASATGFRFTTFAARQIPPGYYYLGFLWISATTAQVRRPFATRYRDTPLGYSANFIAPFISLIEGTGQTNFPTTATGVLSTAGAALMGLRQA